MKYIENHSLRFEIYLNPSSVKRHFVERSKKNHTSFALILWRNDLACTEVPKTWAQYGIWIRLNRISSNLSFIIIKNDKHKNERLNREKRRLFKMNTKNVWIG